MSQFGIVLRSVCLNVHRLDVPAAWRNVLFATWKELREDAKQDRASSPSKARPASRRLPWNLPSTLSKDKKEAPAPIPEADPPKPSPPSYAAVAAQPAPPAEEAPVEENSILAEPEAADSDINGVLHSPTEAAPTNDEPAVVADDTFTLPSIENDESLLNESSVPPELSTPSVEAPEAIEEPPVAVADTPMLPSTENDESLLDESAGPLQASNDLSISDDPITEPPNNGIANEHASSVEHSPIPEPSVELASPSEPVLPEHGDAEDSPTSEKPATLITIADPVNPTAEESIPEEIPIAEHESEPIPTPGFDVPLDFAESTAEEAGSSHSVQDITQIPASVHALEEEDDEATLFVPPVTNSEESEKPNQQDDPEAQSETVDVSRAQDSEETHAAPDPSSSSVDNETLERIKRLEERIVELEALVLRSEAAAESLKEELKVVGEYLVEQARRSAEHTRELSTVLENVSGISRTIKAIGITQLVPLTIYSSFGLYALLRFIRATSR